MVQVGITGANGRMGQALLQATAEVDGIELAGKQLRGERLQEVFKTVDCVVDFTLPEFTSEVIEFCQDTGFRLVLGTTGLSPEIRQQLEAASEQIAICAAPNFSVGVNTLFWLARHASAILGDDFDLEVVEMHHRHKRDAPSGTATRLAEVIAQARGLAYPQQAIFGREGDLGPRPKEQIAVHTLRGGDVVGDHTAIFAAEGERVELSHRASSRQTFALGALRAALWLADKPAGLYDMEDVLGLAH